MSIDRQVDRYSTLIALDLSRNNLILKDQIYNVMINTKTKEEKKTNLITKCSNINVYEMRDNFQILSFTL